MRQWIQKTDGIYIDSVELTTFTSVMGEELDTCVVNIRLELQALVMKDQLFDLFCYTSLNQTATMKEREQNNPNQQRHTCQRLC